MHVRTNIFATGSLLLSLGTAQVTLADPQRLEVSSNGRYLVEEDGTPFFWMGDTNWRMYKLTRNEIDEYLDNRKSKQFNVIQGPVLLASDEGPQSTNAYGEFNSNPNNPNEDWFDHIDYIVDAAADRNMYVALTVTWGDDWDIFSSNSKARAFGKWLGERYRNDENVIWIVAGEHLIEGTNSQIRSVWNSLGKGLNEGSDNNNLITIHGSFQEDRQSSSVYFHDESWLDFNMIHSGQSGDGGSGADNFNLVYSDFNENPTKPALDGEANYEQLSGWDAFGVRRRAYWSVFAGAFGHTYGANAVWSSYMGGNDDDEGGPTDTWNNSLNFEGANDMKHLRRLMESRPAKRSPSQSMLLSNAGSVPDRMQVTRGSSGRYAMIYVPGSNRSFTVNLDKLSGSTAKAWWFNPRSGKATSIGSFSSSGAKEFTTPNSGDDWVLVLDDKSQGYSKPGTGGPLN